MIITEGVLVVTGNCRLDRQNMASTEMKSGLKMASMDIFIIIV